MSDSSDGNLGVAGFLFISGPAAGLFVYNRIQAKYRNRSARYMPERDVARDVADMVVEDAFTEEATVANSSITGRNDGTPAVRAAFSKVIKT